MLNIKYKHRLNVILEILSDQLHGYFQTAYFPISNDSNRKAFLISVCLDMFLFKLFGHRGGSKGGGGFG